MSCGALGTRLRALEAAAFGEDAVGGTFDIESDSDDFESAIMVPLVEGQVVLIKFEAVCRSADSLERAGFQRTGLFFRKGSVQAERFWHTVFTIRSRPAFDVDYQLGVTFVRFRVKSPFPGVRWSGSVSVLSV